MSIGAIAGAVVGSLFGGLQLYSQKKAQDRAAKLAQQQYENARQTALNEEQERAKMQGKEVDVEGLLDGNSTDAFATDLTKGKVKNKLWNPAPTLGGGKPNGGS